MSLWEATVMAYAKGSDPEAAEEHELRQLWRPNAQERAALRRGDEKCEPNAYGRLAYIDAAEHAHHVLGMMTQGELRTPVPTTYWPDGKTRADGSRAP